MARIGVRGAALLLGGLLLVVAFAVWFADIGPTTAAVRPTIAAPPAGRPAGADLRGPGSDGSRLEVDAPVARPSTQIEALASDARIIEPPLEQGVPIRVLRGRSEEPVPHAIVSSGEYHAYRDASVLEMYAYGSAIEDHLRNLKHYEADDQGLVLLPRTSAYVYAFAEAGELWGWIEFTAEPRYEPIPLRLMPDDDVVVRVLAGPERAALPGAEVALRYEISPDDVSTLDTAITDASGIARFEHLRQHTSAYWAHTEKISVELAGVFAGAAGVVFDPEDVPELIELEAPTFTALDVTVLGPDGRPSAEPVLVTVGLGAEEPEGGVKRVAYDGSVAFGQIGAGLEVSLTGRTWFGATTEVVHTRTAPNAGGRVPVALKLGAAPPSLAGRLLMPDGSPAAERDVNGGLGVLSRRTRVSIQARTDADGRFRLDNRVMQSQGRLELTLRLEDGPADLSAVTQIDGPAVGEVWLGDIVLQVDPLLVAGRVQDDRGEPIDGATIAVVGVDAAGRANGTLTMARTETDGTFTTYGRCTSAAIRLDPRHRLYGSGEHPLVAPGTGDVVLVLPSAGGMSGAVLLDAEWLCDFTIALARPAEGKDWTQETWLERPGIFAFEGLVPGRWTVRVAMEGDDEHGVTLEDVEVKVGAMTRVGDVDLRGKAGVRTFHVVDEYGEPIPEGDVYHRALGELEWSGGSWFERGEAHVFTVLSELDLYVTAEGRRSAFVPRAREDQDIVLTQGIQVRFRASDPLTTAEGRFALVGLRGDDPAMPSVHVGLDVGAETSEVTYLPHGGDYVLDWQCFDSLKSGGIRQVEGVQEALTIRDKSEIQDVALTVPPEVLAFLSGAE